MKREYPETPFVGVGAVVIEADRVILVKRANPPLKGEWSIPGGVLEVGEMLRDTAMREAREETGLLVEPSSLLGVYDRVLRDTDGRPLYHYVLIDFFCRKLSGEARAGGDAAEVHWFSEAEIAGLNLAPDTEEVVKKGFELQRKASPTQQPRFA